MHLYNLHEVAKLKMLSYCGLCSIRVPKFSWQFLATDMHMTSKPIAALPMAKISASCMLQLKLLELFGWHLSGFGLQNSTNTLLLLTRKDIKEESHPSQSKFARTKRLWEHNARYFVGSVLKAYQLLRNMTSSMAAVNPPGSVRESGIGLGSPGCCGAKLGSCGATGQQNTNLNNRKVQQLHKISKSWTRNSHFSRMFLVQACKVCLHLSWYLVVRQSLEGLFFL